MNAQESAMTFLYELGKHIANEDNLATQAPLFVVKGKDRQFGIDPDYSYTGYIWVDDRDSEEVDEDIASILELVPYEKIPSHYEKRYYRDIDVSIQPFLTREAAENYITQNEHNIASPFIYVESAYRNHQIIGLRKIALDVYRGETNKEAQP